MATLLKVISSFLAVLALGCGLGALFSALMTVLAVIPATLKLIGVFDWWADPEDVLIFLFVFVVFAAGFAVSYKMSDWLGALAKRVEYSRSLRP